MKITIISCTENPEQLIERMARICYDSDDKKYETSYVPMLNALIKRGHHSLLEHASASFIIDGVSRNTTHQLVRHRHMTFSQRSQRYCMEDDGKLIAPTGIEGNAAAMAVLKATAAAARSSYKELIDLGIKKEDARAVLPGSWTSKIGVSSNFREWLHVIDLRVSQEAQEEIRGMMTGIWSLLYDIAPTVFGLNYFEHHGHGGSFEFKQEIFQTKIKKMED